MDSIKVFSPGSITNLSCGYDILGVCLENRGDEITVTKTNKKEITIKSNDEYDISKDINLTMIEDCNNFIPDVIASQELHNNPSIIN